MSGGYVKPCGVVVTEMKQAPAGLVVMPGSNDAAAILKTCGWEPYRPSVLGVCVDVTAAHDSDHAPAGEAVTVV